MLDDFTRTYSVGELGEHILGVLETAFQNDVWVQGTIVNLNRSKYGHVYFDLIEPAEAPGQPPLGSISVALFKMNREVVNRLLKRNGSIRMEDGVQVRIRGVVTFYPPTGRLQLRMTSIDPMFTLGSLAADREKVLRRLAEAGVLELQKQLSLPAPPQRIGLITSIGSAAYHDFVTELERAELWLEVIAVDVQVQGARSEAAVCAALSALDRAGVDLVALVRGGGSRTDLAAFDSERMARMISALTVPVLTGIGHEIDRSIADEAAHLAFKTPTACAQHIANLALVYAEECEVAFQQICERVDELFDEHDAHTAELAHRTARATRALVARHEDRQRHLAERLVRDGRRSTARATSRVERDHAAVVALAGRASRRAEGLIAQSAAALPTIAARALDRAERALSQSEGRARAHDPARILARGFSLTRTADGAVVRSRAQAGPGTTLRTTVGDGIIESVVSNEKSSDG